MSGNDYTKTHHVATLEQALEDLCEAMTFRWREVVTQAICLPLNGTLDYPTQFERQTSSHDTPMWEYWSAPAECHLSLMGSKCAFVRWINDGQKKVTLSSVTCEGETGSPKDDPFLDEYDNPIPPKIDCGMGRILEQIESWAKAECEVVLDRLPKFDLNDLTAIKNAHDDFIKVGHQLTLNKGEDAGDVSKELELEGMDSLDIPQIAGTVADQSSEGQTWWKGWTGLAASKLQAGFFSSVIPTMNNQSIILGALANLYSVRASIIEEARSNSLYWIQKATKALDETQTITTNLVPAWKVVQGIGAAVTVGSGWTVIGGVIGASITLTGFLGENLIPEEKTEGYASELEEVVKKLFKEVDGINSTLEEAEKEYSESVDKLAEEIWDRHSFNLELYDLTENSPDGDRTHDDGFTAEVDQIFLIGAACFKAGEKYDELLPKINDTTDVDEHLSGKDGKPIKGDTTLLELRDQLKGFLKTTTGRYLLAGEQIKAAGTTYGEVEDEQATNFEGILDEWETEKLGEYDSDIDPEKWAKDTDRGSDPGSGKDEPAGKDDGEEYRTDDKKS